MSCLGDNWCRFAGVRTSTGCRSGVDAGGLLYREFHKFLDDT